MAQRLFNNESALDHYVKLDGITHKVIGVSEYQDNVYANELWGINNVGFIPYTAARSYQRNPKIRELVFTATDIIIWMLLGASYRLILIFITILRK